MSNVCMKIHLAGWVSKKKQRACLFNMNSLWVFLLEKSVFNPFHNFWQAKQSLEILMCEEIKQLIFVFCLMILLFFKSPFLSTLMLLKKLSENRGQIYMCSTCVIKSKKAFITRVSVGPERWNLGEGRRLGTYHEGVRKLFRVAFLGAGRISPSHMNKLEKNLT
jgi:hypothetical protein